MISYLFVCLYILFEVLIGCSLKPSRIGADQQWKRWSFIDNLCHMGRSCLTKLISFYDLVRRLVVEGMAVDVVYLVFSKAFDTVSHSILLQKLAVRGLDRYTLIEVRPIQNEFLADKYSYRSLSANALVHFLDKLVIDTKLFY